MKQLFSIIALAIIGCACAKAFSVDTVTVATTRLESPMKVTVITPDGSQGQKYPSVYLLNGYSGDYRAWCRTQPRLGQFADRLGMVLVMPDGRDSWYWDSPSNPEMQMESFIVKDLVPYIDANFPTMPERAMRAVTGLSMGGHGALYLAARHPEVFGNAGSMSGGVDIRPFPKSWGMAKLLGKTLEEDPALWDSHTVATLIPQLKEAKLNITFDCGKDDFFAKVNDKLHADMLAADIPHDYTVRPGNHSHKYWANSILYHLLFFNQAFRRK